MDKEKFFSAAQKFADKSQYDKAIKELSRLIEQDPNDCRALLRIGDYTQKMGYPGEAMQYFVRVADIYRKEGAASKALAVLKQAQKLGVQDKKLSPMLADLYYSIGLPNDAMPYYRQSLEYYESTGSETNYLQTLQMMIRIDSEDAQLRQLYAHRLLQTGDESGFKRQYELLFSLLLSKQRYAEYVQAGREYLKIFPDNEEVLKQIALIYVKTSYYKEALDLLKLIPHPERKSDVLSALSACYEGLGRKQEAVEALKDLARLYESEERDHSLISSTWMKAQALDPQDPEVNLALLVGPYADELPLLGQSALTAIEPSHFPGAASRLSRPASGTSQIARIKIEDANAHFRRFEYDKALVLCSEALQIDENMPEALELLLKINLANEDFSAAAATERRRATSLWGKDKDKAIESILAAERYSPRALENFNLLLSFGLDPTSFGFSAPLMRPRSEQVQKSPQFLRTASQEILPRPQVSSSSPKPPPLPPPLPPGLRSRSVEAVSKPMSDKVNSSDDTTAAPSAQAQVLVQNWGRKTAATIELPAPIRKLPSKIIDDLRDIEQSNRSNINLADEASNSSSFFSDFDDSAFDDHFDELFSDLFSESEKQVIVAREKKAESQIKPEVNDASSLPQAMMDKVSEQIKEAEFFISIGLLDDAEILTKNLLSDYGSLALIRDLQDRLLKARAGSS